MAETQRSISISTHRQRIATKVANHPDEALTTLAHHMDEAWLYEAYRRTRKDGAAGIDGQTAAEYEQNLEENLQSLLRRVHSGAYVAPPVRRTYIPKGDGQETRPLGIPTFEDKILQRAVAMVLECLYEPLFHEHSYGFRPGRSAHQALRTVWKTLMDGHGGWVLEVDIRRFFDTVDHGQLRTILRQRVGDGTLLRLINKWLKAGVMEGGQRWRAQAGTPQGGVISPLLANIFLHEVLDEWFEATVKPCLQGSAQLVRFADDAVLLFERADDAQRVMNVLPKRFGRFNLSLHPEKTRLVPFRQPPKGIRRPRRKPGTFDLLGFTHYWTRSWRGRWVIKRKTAKDRMRRLVKAFDRWCQRNRHRPLWEQQLILRRKLRGVYAYFGIRGNVASLQTLVYRVRCSWRRWLNRRSQRGTMPWRRFRQLLRVFPLPEPGCMAAV